MIEVKSKLTYSIGKNMPYFSPFLPHGTSNYDKLKEYHDIDTLCELIKSEISNLQFSINKYDSIYEPENAKMVENMKNILSYLDENLETLEKF